MLSRRLFLTDSERALLDNLRATIKAEYGEDLNLGTHSDFEVEVLPLGIPKLDWALGGGLAFGRMAQFYGPKSAGKTALAYRVMAQGQARNLPIVFLDIEHSWEPEWARTIGVDPERVLVSRPDTGEKAFDIALTVVSDPAGGVLVLDSLAMLTYADEITTSDKRAPMERNFVGLAARKNNKALKLLAQANNNWVVIIINQLREKVGVIYGSPETLPGGKAQEYVAWQQVRVSRGASIEEEGEEVGYHLKIYVPKNKQGPPFRRAEAAFFYAYGIDEVASLVETGKELGIFGTKKGGHFTWQGGNIRGSRALLEVFRDDEQRALLLKELEDISIDIND